MRFYSHDRNCCIDTGQGSNSGQSGEILRADITIRYPSLVRIRLQPRRNEFIIRSRISNKDICSFPRDELDQNNPNGIDLALLHGLPVKLLQDFQEDSQSASAAGNNAFHIIIPEVDSSCLDEHELHPEVETLLLDIITKRKKQDEQELANFMDKQRMELAAFESQVNSQAAALSNLVLHSFRLDERKKSTRRSWDADASKERSRDRRLSSNSSQSASSTTSQERTRKRSSKGHVERLSDTSSGRLPKPALITPLRKASLESNKKDGLSPMTPLKRVMFSEQEPTQISSDHTLDASDTEEDETSIKPQIMPEADDLFDMDEQISAASTNHRGSALSSPAIADLPDETTSFGFEDLVNDKTVVSVSSETPPSGVEASPGIAESYTTSIPQPIARAPPAHSAPLSSVKDLPSFSPSVMDHAIDPLIGDTPPTGMSRKLMWQQAVASSLRMSGFVLPSMTSDEIDTPLTTDLPSPRKVHA